MYLKWLKIVCVHGRVCFPSTETCLSCTHERIWITHAALFHRGTAAEHYVTQSNNSALRPSAGGNAAVKGTCGDAVIPASLLHNMASSSYQARSLNSWQREPTAKCHVQHTVPHWLRQHFLLPIRRRLLPTFTIIHNNTILKVLQTSSSLTD